MPLAPNAMLNPIRQQLIERGHLKPCYDDIMRLPRGTPCAQAAPDALAARRRDAHSNTPTSRALAVLNAALLRNDKQANPRKNT